jgi:glycosyltransferase involved in cell wall biosynthesis
MLDAKTPENKSIAAQNSDIVVFHRPEEPGKLELAKLLKQQGKKIVFDNDDTLKHDGGFRFNKYMDMKRVQKGMKKLNETIDEFIKEADLVTCSTQYLADEYSKINPNVIVIPNFIDPFYFPKPLRNKNGKVRIGITGSLALTDDIDLVEPIVRHYENNPDIEIVLFSLPPAHKDKYTRKLYQEEYKFWESIKVEWQPLVPMEEYYETLNNLKLDIMIIPRADNYFNRCKSNVKFLEASMFEIPVIAQGFPDGKSPYEIDPEDKENLVLVSDNTKWVEEIDKMIADKKGRKALGKKAKKYVEKKYSIDNNAHKWVEAYQTIL